MKRRDVITLLGGAAAWPVAAQAQQKAQARRIGVLMALRQDDAEMQARVGAFKQELRKLGWLNHREVVIIERWPADDMDRILAQMLRKSSPATPMSFSSEAGVRSLFFTSLPARFRSSSRALAIRLKPVSWAA